MKCRDMLCAKDRERLNINCMRSSSTNKTCYSVLIIMTYVGGEADMLSDSVDDDTFLDSLELLLADLIGGFYDKTSRMDVFIKRRSKANF